VCAAQVVKRLQGTLPVVIDHATWEETAGNAPGMKGRVNNMILVVAANE
jgi:hypothetical protein